MEKLCCLDQIFLIKLDSGYIQLILVNRNGITF